MTSATESPIRRAVVRSFAVQGSQVPSTTWCHWAKDRRGESWVGSSPVFTAFVGVAAPGHGPYPLGPEPDQVLPGPLERGTASRRRPRGVRTGRAGAHDPEVGGGHH